MTDIRFLALVGSLRSGSANAATARAAAAHAPDGVGIDIYDVQDLPFYNGDEEDAGPPAQATALHAAVAASNGIIFFSPEYNGSFPAVTKNALDWLSRPPVSWAGTPVTLVATTPGPRAGLGIRDHFSSIMAHQPTRLFDTHGIGTYGDKIDGGELTDSDAVSELVGFLDRFAAFSLADDGSAVD